MVECFRPHTLAEALSIRKAKDVIPFAGGTDLMVTYRGVSETSTVFPDPVLFVDGIAEIKEIKRAADGFLSIGAGCTLTSVLSNNGVPALIKAAVGEIAAPAIRNRATLAGNICNSSPAGDSLPALYVLGAKLKLLSSSTERVVPVEKFITGPGKNVLRNDEILTEIIIPLHVFSIIYYRKVGTRKANALSKLSIAAAADVKEEKLMDIRVALGAVGPTIIRDRDIESGMIGLNIKNIKIEKILKAYENLIRPIDDQRSTAAYRKKVTLNLVKYFLTQYIKPN
ncbi:MAG: FAD binding domain-containing protein [Spirochaetota bacterium]